MDIPSSGGTGPAPRARDASSSHFRARPPLRPADCESVNIPLDELRTRAAEIPAGPVIVTCAVGQRGHTAGRLLGQLGRDVANLDGGYRTWAAGALR